MSIIGKTVAWVDGDSWDTVIHFTDGTALRTSSDDGHYMEDLGWAEVQARAHAAQGHREQERMRRLHDMLHPRDKQWLQLQAKRARDRAAEIERVRREQWIADHPGEPRPWVFSDVLKAEFVDTIRASLQDANRVLFAGPRWVPKTKKKHRPYTAPVKYKAGEITISKQLLDEYE